MRRSYYQSWTFFGAIKNIKILNRGTCTRLRRSCRLQGEGKEKKTNPFVTFTFVSPFSDPRARRFEEIIIQQACLVNITGSVPNLDSAPRVDNDSDTDRSSAAWVTMRVTSVLRLCEQDSTPSSCLYSFLFPGQIYLLLINDFVAFTLTRFIYQPLGVLQNGRYGGSSIFIPLINVQNSFRKN